MPDLLNSFFRLIEIFEKKQSLCTEAEAESFINLLANPDISDIKKAALTTAWKVKGENPPELFLIANYLLNLIGRLETGLEIIDCCGTGGDNAQTFNISTTSAFVAAAAGVKIAKHGGRKTTSASGSIDFLEAIGIPCFSEPAQIKTLLERTNLVFISSPIMKNVLGSWKSICKELGFAGQTGLIGTLTNPVKLNYQIIGVPKPEWGNLMIETLQLLKRKKALVIHGFPCLDEGSLCGLNKIWLLENDKITQSEIDPKDLGLNKYYDLSEIQGGNPAQNAQIFFDFINSKASPAIEKTILFNAGLILWLYGKSENALIGFQQAEEILKSGKLLDFWHSYKKVITSQGKNNT